MPRGDGVKKISDLFESYRKRLKAPEGSVIVSFIEVVEDVLGVTLEKKQVRYTPASKTLSLQAPSLLKNEIKLKEEEILTHLKGRLGEKSAPKYII